MATADPPIYETPSSLAEVKEAARTLKGGKVAAVCDITAMLKTRGEAMIHGLHPVLSGSPVPLLLTERGTGCPYLLVKRDQQDCSNYRGITEHSMPEKVLPRLT